MDIKKAELYVKYSEIIETNGYVYSIEYNLINKNDLKDFLIFFKEDILLEIIDNNNMLSEKIYNYFEYFSEDKIAIAFLKTLIKLQELKIETTSEINQLRTIIEEQDVKINELIGYTHNINYRIDNINN